MELSALSVNNLGLPSPEEIQGAFRLWEPDPATFLLSKDIPLENWYAGELYAYDVLQSVTGMTQPYKGEGEPLPAALPLLGNTMERSIEFKEYIDIKANDFQTARKPGTLGQLDGSGLVMRANRTLWTRLMVLLEYMRWSMFLGSLSINANGVNRTFNYNLPNTPTAGTLWSNTGSADPRSDIEAWDLLFRGVTNGKSIGYMNKKVAGYISQNAAFLDLVKQNPLTVQQVGRDAIAEVFPALVGLVDKMVIYDGGYKDSSGTWTPFIPDNKFIMVAPPVDGQPLASLVTTPSVHNGGANPQPGMFTFQEDHLQEKHSRFSCVAGINVGPKLVFPQNIVCATIA